MLSTITQKHIHICQSQVCLGSGSADLVLQVPTNWPHFSKSIAHSHFSHSLLNLMTSAIQAESQELSQDFSGGWKIHGANFFSNFDFFQKKTLFQDWLQGRIQFSLFSHFLSFFAKNEENGQKKFFDWKILIICLPFFPVSHFWFFSFFFAQKRFEFFFQKRALPPCGGLAPF